MRASEDETADQYTPEINDLNDEGLAHDSTEPTEKAQTRSLFYHKNPVSKSTDVKKLLPFHGDEEKQRNHQNYENVKQRFLERKENYQNRCQARAITSGVAISQTQAEFMNYQMPYHFLVSTQHNLGACLPMKTGSSSMFHYIWEMDHPDPEDRQPVIDGLRSGDPAYGGKFYHLKLSPSFK